jgi:large subunit ribosomal protein L32e
MARKKEIKELSDLPYYRKEYTAQLEKMDITTPAELYQALQDAPKRKEVIDTLDGVGDKIADHWEELLATAETAVAVPEKAEVVEEKPAEAAVVEEGAYVVKIKPELSAEVKAMLAYRDDCNARRPEFKRQEWFRFARLEEKWRKPRGMHSKMRRHYKYRPTIVSIGFRGPALVRDYHPSGFKEVMVHNVKELTGVDPKTQAVRIGGTVGQKKRTDIIAKADAAGIRVLNR